ncbi:hypothetical protein HAX54_009438 [Datura stramonium]|uniref:Uncharacterized protein n=1 Tax=Datura stramonium TaxID=4076 RepID=A0ABS8RWH6_DATST|nr:hypothetical protein [Datura stramonium]
MSTSSQVQKTGVSARLHSSSDKRQPPNLSTILPPALALLMLILDNMLVRVCSFDDEFSAKFPRLGSQAGVPLTFRLMRVRGLPAWANSEAVSISDVIQTGFLVLCNAACPTLKRIPNVLVIHGEGDGSLECMKQELKVIIHTANLINVDWNNKSQGLWMQDFPWKEQNNLGKDGGFENDLVGLSKR